MQIVDFTNLPKRNKMYAGLNGSRDLYDLRGRQQYMLKFPPPYTKKQDELQQQLLFRVSWLPDL